MGRKRNLGLAVGCLWLVVVSTSFAAVSLLVVRSAAATVLLVAIFLLAVVLVVMSIATLRAVFHVQDTTEPRPSEGRRLGRRFGAIAGVEGLVLTIVTLACVFTRRWALIAPLDLMIVGLHFLPLAKLFNVPRYNITGLCSVESRSRQCCCFLPNGLLVTPSAGSLSRAWAVRQSLL